MTYCSLKTRKYCITMDKQKKSLNLSMWILTVALAIVFFLPDLVKEGMFFDGLVYSTISRNLAYGYGSLWKPMYTPTLWLEFYEHPSLVFGIQSLFFRIFGEGMFVERLFSLSTLLVSGFLIHKLWIALFKDDEEKKRYSWIPLLTWVMMPSVYMTYSRNMLENVLTCFSLWAIYLGVLALMHQKRTYLYLTLVGVLTFLAFLSKGFVGLFPLALVFIYAFVFRDMGFRQWSVRALLPLLSFGGCILLLSFSDEAWTGIGKYIDQQVLSSINGTREKAKLGRFHLLIKMMQEVIYPLLFCLLAFFFYRKSSYTGVTLPKVDKNRVFFFLLLWVSASFPIMVSHKQASYYAAPSFPYFTIAIAMVTAHYWPSLEKETQQKGNLLKVVRIVAVVTFVAANVVWVTFLSKSRDADYLDDVQRLGVLVPQQTAMHDLQGHLSTDLNLNGYLFRYNYQHAKQDSNATYAIIENSHCADCDFPSYKLVEKMKVFSLYTKKE